jgi:hypothetical protein
MTSVAILSLELFLALKIAPEEASESIIWQPAEMMEDFGVLCLSAIYRGSSSHDVRDVLIEEGRLFLSRNRPL